MRKKLKKKTYEKLSDSNIAHVIKLLAGSPPITKKQACEILNINYNTTRLNKIIQQYQDDLEYRSRKKAEKRGKPADRSEISHIVESYLSGDPIAEIAKRVFRSPSFVSSVIQRVGVPERVTGEDKYSTELLPEECIAEEFAPGEIAWSAKYHAACEIRKKLPEKYDTMYATPCYQIWVRTDPSVDSEYFGRVEGGGYNAFVPAYDLGKLTHLQEFGVDITRL